MEFNDIIANLPEPYYRDEQADIAIYCADCRDILPLIPDKSIDLVLTDPPYPDQHPEYGVIDMRLLFEKYTCPQLIFWSAKVEFPLAHITAIHIWDKLTGCASEYERIFERYGQTDYKMFRAYLINSIVAAQYARDEFYGHPSQKPQKLINTLILNFTDYDDLVLDPFLGSGTTAYCAKKLGRKCIGIEIEEKYCEIAVKRLNQSVMKLG